MTDIQDIVAAAGKLPPAERLKIVDGILDSVDATDATIDAAWPHEAEERLAAYRRGDVRALALSDVIAKYAKT